MATLPSHSADILDLQQQIARLQALLETSRQVHSTIHLHEVLACVLRIVVRELELPGALITEPRLSYGELPPEPWKDCVRFPLHNKDGKHLTDLVVATPGGRCLSLYEEDFLEGLAVQAAVAIENARYHERNVEWARVQQDLDAARAIQRSLLPQRMPAIPGYSIGVRSSTCYEVGGDYVDILSLPHGALVMAVADVAGKGLASAIMSTAFRAAFRAIAVAGLPLADVACRLNEQHYAEGPEARRRYVTAIFLKLDPAAHRIEIVNAGHNPAFLLTADTVREIAASGTPIGLVPEMRYTPFSADFPPGARLLFYTDGLTEVFRGEDEFGSARLVTAFRDCRDDDGRAILDSLWRQLDEFSQGMPQQDDMTALALIRTRGNTADTREIA